MRNYQLILAFFVFFSVKGQNEANIWYFGFNAGLDFNSGSPGVLLNGALNTNEGCATISDTDGNLLFYTDGVTVYNRNHNIMPNGSGLSGSFSSTHSAIVIPQPNEEDKYYIFTVDVYNNGDTNGLQYSEVDMALDNGFGDVTAIKNIPLEPIVNEKVIAVLNSNGDGYWVVSHRFNSNIFLVYEINSAGVNIIPNEIAVGVNTGFLNVSGQIKISPNGNRLAVVHGEEVQLFDFDSATGIISNEQNIITNSTIIPYGIEFSPTGNVLYVSFVGGVFQYNLLAGSLSDIVNSQINLIDINEGFASLQIAPNGKIYVAKTGLFHLDIIENPNIVGVGCNYNYAGLYLGGRESRLGLPTFMQSFFNVSFQAEDGCEGDTTEFSANISQTYDTLTWDFGDGNTSTNENPTHTYATAGDYEVSLSVIAGTENSIDSKTITIYENPIVTPIVDLRQCDDDLDGFSSFNLNEANAEISVNYLDETITYYESQLDAENNNNAISNITVYINEVVSVDSIWARVENNHGCYAISQINLIVSTTQIANTFIGEFYECDDGADTTDGIATFNLSAINNDVVALFPVGQQLTINYYRTIEDALAEDNAIADISNYENTGYPNTQDIYVRVDSALDNDCLGLGHHITLYVETVPVANTVMVTQQCDDDGDGLFAFDTTNIETELLDGQTDVTVSYIDESGVALPSPLPNPFNSTSQTITARVTNANSQDPDGACYDEIQIEFTVDAAAEAYAAADLIACDDNNDGQFAFDTSTIESTILNGQTGMLVTYRDEAGNALSSPLPNPFITETQSITVRVENQLSTDCYDETVVNFIVSEQPIAHPITDDFVCDDPSNNGQHSFTLSHYDSQILAEQTSTTFEVFYFENEADAIANIDPLQNTYLVNSTSQTVYGRIQNTINLDCFEITSFQLGVHYLPMANQPDALLVCDDDTNDGFEMFDLTVQNSDILNGQSATENSVSYYVSLSDAETRTNTIGSNFINTENPQTIYARLENNNFPACYTTTSFQVLVKEQPVLLMDNETPICDGETVQLTADLGYDYYNWSTGQTTRSITVDEPGNYTVTVSNDYGSLVCSTEKTINVAISNIATITNIETVDWTQNDNVISVFVEGFGDYEYSIDGFNYQDESIFNGLIIDEYTVYVRDKNGCGIVSESIYLLNYPRFFTPNGDGENDYWQIKNSVKEPLNKLHIYNRYGKLIIQLRPNDFGWDGTLNGSKLPSSDYWFVLERQNGKTYTGHFALKR